MNREINIDMFRNNYDIIRVTQNDSLKLDINLTKNGSKIDISKYSISFEITTPSGHYIIQDDNISKVDGRIIVNINDNITVEYGECLLVVKLVDSDSNSTTSKPVIVDVSKSILDDKVLLEEDVITISKELDKVIVKALQTKQELNELISNSSIETIINRINANESNINSYKDSNNRVINSLSTTIENESNNFNSFKSQTESDILSLQSLTSTNKVEIDSVKRLMLSTVEYDPNTQVHVLDNDNEYIDLGVISEGNYLFTVEYNLNPSGSDKYLTVITFVLTHCTGYYNNRVSNFIKINPISFAFDTNQVIGPASDFLPVFSSTGTQNKEPSTRSNIHVKVRRGSSGVKMNFKKIKMTRI